MLSRQLQIIKNTNSLFIFTDCEWKLLRTLRASENDIHSFDAKYDMAFVTKSNLGATSLRLDNTK